VEGNIPGGGMSRSASLSINLLLAFFDVHSLPISPSVEDGLRIVSLAQQIENDYIGSPCGNLDQIMVYPTIFIAASSTSPYLTNLP
jgi:galactokinase